ncbi:type II secretion system F family protein [Candidatus Woesearchaeota archaeon]|nr:type II secretion system F family protein [Candidatus Woesearchaeota archaeon]
MPDTVEDFVKKIFVTSFYFAIGLAFFLLMIFLRVSEGAISLTFLLFMLFLLPILVLIIFTYLLKIPDARIIKAQKNVGREIVFATRFLLIEIESGVALYNAMTNISKNYEQVGKYFSDLINKVDLGTKMEDALSEAVELAPSEDLKKIFWQIMNSLSTGADITHSLKAIIAQIVREQQIAVKEYSRKLNPLAMFYMMMAVIVPSLGVTMMVILATFMGIQLNLVTLLSIALFIGLIQMMFIAMVKGNRPAVDM